MGTIISSVKETALDAKERVCGIYNLFAYEQALSETVLQISNLSLSMQRHTIDELNSIIQITILQMQN